jgi:hypothetical protein
VSVALLLGTSLAHHDRNNKRPRLDEAQYKARLSAAGDLLRIQRTLKPYNEAGETQRQQRVSILTTACAGLSMPATALTPTTPPSPSSFFHIPEHHLKHLRGVTAIAGKRQIQQHRRERAPNDGTTTAVFEVFRGDAPVQYAYLSDPRRFVQQHILPYGSRMAIGADKGGDTVKFGVTYMRGAHLTYAPLVVFTGPEDYDAFAGLAESHDCFHFTGDSTDFISYVAVFEWLIREHNAKLNGDWKAINTIVGLSTASATYGCCICLSPVRSLVTGALRSAAQHQADLNAALDEPDPSSNHSVMRLPLLAGLRSSDIVPLPLHIFLGLGNLFIDEVYPALLSKEVVEAAVQKVRGRRALSFGGAAREFQLTGPELKRWIDTGAAAGMRIREQRVRFTSADGAPVVRESRGSVVKQRIATMERWLAALCRLLLKSEQFSANEVAELRAVQHDVWNNWHAVTGRAPTPKVHMLAHAVAFAAKHGHLGFYAESQMESSHFRFQYSYDHTHRNASANPPEHLRRALVSLILPLVGPLPRRFTQVPVEPSPCH